MLLTPLVVLLSNQVSNILGVADTGCPENGEMDCLKHFFISNRSGKTIYLPDGNQSIILPLVFNTYFTLTYFIYLQVSNHDIPRRDREYSELFQIIADVYSGSQSPCWRQNRIFWAVTSQSKILGLDRNIFFIIILAGFKGGQWRLRGKFCIIIIINCFTFSFVLILVSHEWGKK